MKNRSSLPLFSNLFIALALEIGLAGDSNTRPDEAYWIGAEETSIPGDADWSLSADRFGSGARGAMQGFRIREDLDCLALNIYFEARSESTLGRRAVGHVVMNRVNHRDFPHSICEVVRQGGSRVLNRCQFSWWCDGQSDIPYNRVQWILALKLAYNIYTGASKDPTGGALWYHADYSNPTWGRAFRRGPKIGRHIFYRESHAKSRFL